MPAHRLRLRLAAIVIGTAGLGATAAFAAAGDAAATIYQQRAADGRIVLTDRPSPTATTERSWQMEREDPVAARARAAEVQRQAEAVSQRVQRSIDLQEMRLAEAERDRATARRERAYDVSSEGETGVLIAPYGYGFGGNGYGAGFGRYGDRSGDRVNNRFDRRGGYRSNGRDGQRGSRPGYAPALVPWRGVNRGSASPGNR